MPLRDVRMHLVNIRAAADRVQRLTAEKTFEEYFADENLRLIIERSFEIIGEALRQCVAIEPDFEQSIANIRRIINFRNFLIHAYDLIDHSIVWDIIQTYLPALQIEIEREIKRRT